MLGQDGIGLRPFVARRREEEGHAIMNRQHQIEAAVVLFAAMLYLTGSFWKAILVSVLVLVSCVLGFGLRGSFAIAIVAIALVLGAPSPDQWEQWWQDATSILHLAPWLNRPRKKGIAVISAATACETGLTRRLQEKSNISPR